MKIEENSKLKPYHWIASILIIPSFGLFAGFYGWIYYSTIFDRNGVWGNMHSYYDLTKEQFSSIRLFISLTLIGLILFQSKYLIEKNMNRLNKTLLITLIFIGIWIIGEFYLQTKFIGKG
ncbi:hypothetical protein D7030_13190 [Flavobacteriaceae bacterium AU392]|nr:hypothetical protein D1817_05300 [Flavobacteriaceae bacterium]RKM81257.1 hypothetical protein D7030_13190 [Flavobacteriaceae bacterium AU392]